MNCVIYKYTLEVTDEQTLTLPEGVRILSVANQADRLVLYARVDARVDPRKPATSAVRVFIFGTGNPAPISDAARFVGTVAQFGGRLMWHVFVEGGGEGG